MTPEARARPWQETVGAIVDGFAALNAEELLRPVPGALRTPVRSGHLRGTGATVPRSGMDVTLVLTHRCNLRCEYCYAGEHHGAAMDEATIRRAVELLFADGAETAQLSFFGGEPFLEFAKMQLAVELARKAAAGRTLLLQCTTNGSLLGPRQVAFVRSNRMRISVSIDGVAEAHDLTRRDARGGSSFAAVARGLRRLVSARTDPSALIVVTPATAPFLFRSVRWLWKEGVERVDVNLELTGRWTLAERDVLREELIAIGREALAQRLRGRDVWLAQLGYEIAEPRRRQVVVGVDGRLFACAPLVNDGRDATRCIGHLDRGAEAA